MRGELAVAIAIPLAVAILAPDRMGTWVVIAMMGVLCSKPIGYLLADGHWWLIACIPVGLYILSVQYGITS